MAPPDPPALRFPHAEPPAFGRPMEVAPGILWLRLRLPYLLDHINLYLFEEEGGWALFDTGLGDDPSREAWDWVLANALGGRPITRLLVSHFHPDHVGLAGWLEQRFAMPLHMSELEYLMTRMLQSAPDGSRHLAQRQFYQAAGLDPELLVDVMGRGQGYLRRTTGIAGKFERLAAGETLRLGGRDWRIFTGGGHALDQVMLWCPADRIFLSADQVLARISPNVSVFEIEPNADPLSAYLASLAQLQAEVAEDVLVLPCHNLPFHGLHERAAELAGHHARRCGQIEAACRDQALSCLEIVPAIFHRRLDAHQLGFALGEALAHINHMRRTGRLAIESAADGVLRYRTL